jgi:hypothetical protein
MKVWAGAWPRDARGTACPELMHRERKPSYICMR